LIKGARRGGVGPVAQAVRIGLLHHDHAGVTHMAGREDIGWHAFAERIFAARAARGDPAAVVDAIATSDNPTRAPRPVVDGAAFLAVRAAIAPDGGIHHRLRGQDSGALEELRGGRASSRRPDD